MDKSRPSSSLITQHRYRIIRMALPWRHTCSWLPTFLKSKWYVTKTDYKHGADDWDIRLSHIFFSSGGTWLYSEKIRRWRQIRPTYGFRLFKCDWSRHPKMGFVMNFWRIRATPCDLSRKYLNTFNVGRIGFYRAAWNADAILRWGVCPSVCLSVCQTRALWQNGRKICPDFYTMRKIILSAFMRRRMVGGGRPLLSEILGQPARVGAKSPILNQ